MRKMIGLVAFGALLTGFVLVSKIEDRSISSNEPTGLKVSDIAPDFNLMNVDGRMISLASVAVATPNLEGFIVTFTCNTCPFAVMYQDRLIALHDKYAPQGWPVVAIQPNDPAIKPGDSFEEMKVRAKEKEFPFVYLFDDGQKVYPQYGATRTPHVFLLDANRKVRYIGAIDNNPQNAGAATHHYVEEAIAAIRAGKEPDPNYTKAIGCGIKAK